jgi:hypothetical protein
MVDDAKRFAYLLMKSETTFISILYSLKENICSVDRQNCIRSEKNA